MSSAGGMRGYESTTRRRRRWVAAVAVTAAATAITVPALLLGRPGGGPPADGSGGGPAGPQPSAVVSASGVPRSTPTEPGPFDLLAGVAEGAAPAVPYLHGVRLVRPDGTTLRLPRAYEQFALVGDRILAVRVGEGGDRAVQLLAADATVLRTGPVAEGFVVEPSGDLAAWATPQGELETVWPSGTLSLGNQGGPVSVAAVIGDASCLPSEGGCRVYVNNKDSRPPASVGPDGTVEAVAPGAIKVDDVHPSGLAAVQLSASDAGSCSGVYDRHLDRFLWRTCRSSLFRFSPQALLRRARQRPLPRRTRARLPDRARRGHRRTGGEVLGPRWLHRPDGWRGRHQPPGARRSWCCSARRSSGSASTAAWSAGVGRAAMDADPHPSDEPLPGNLLLRPAVRRFSRWVSGRSRGDVGTGGCRRRWARSTPGLHGVTTTTSIPGSRRAFPTAAPSVGHRVRSRGVLACWLDGSRTSTASTPTRRSAAPRRPLRGAGQRHRRGHAVGSGRWTVRSGDDGRIAPPPRHRAGASSVRHLLAPGGRFLSVGLARPASLIDHAWDLASMVTNPAIGYVKHPWVPTQGVEPPSTPVGNPA